jgi:dTDP-4-amino-4,6-dideoxygalactose transaminase
MLRIDPPTPPDGALPLVDLSAQHAEIAREVEAGWARVIESSSYVGGEEVAAFEAELAEFWGVRHAVGVGNGTDALELVLRAARIGPGDEVVVPVNSHLAAASAVVRVGATPVFVDVDPVHLHLDVADLAGAIGPATRAVIPVHLFGQMAPLEHIAEVIGNRPIHIVEDAAQAQGAARHGRPPGRVGVAAATSFHPCQNLGAYGDGGAVLTDLAELAEQVRLLGDPGDHARHGHHVAGFDSRLDPLQAVVLRAKLRRLARWNRARQEAATRYEELLGDLPGVVLPATRAGSRHVWHSYAIRVARRRELVERLHAEGIGVEVHQGLPLHLQKAFWYLGYRIGDFPVAEAASQRLLTLPLHPFITIRQQRRISQVIHEELRADAA